MTAYNVLANYIDQLEKLVENLTRENKELKENKSKNIKQ